MSAFTREQLEQTIRRLEARRTAMAQAHRPPAEIDQVTKTLEIVRRRLDTYGKAKEPRQAVRSE